LVEYRLAIELQRRGLLLGIYPVFVGDAGKDPTLPDLRSAYTFADGPKGSASHPQQPAEVVVDSVEEKVRDHLASMGLDRPVVPEMTVKEILEEVCRQSGSLMAGSILLASEAVSRQVGAMIAEAKRAEDEEESAAMQSLTDDDSLSLQSISSTNSMRAVIERAARAAVMMDRLDGKYRAALVADPKDLHTLCSYALFMQTRREDFSKAQELYTRALAVDQNHTRSLYCYGRFLEEIRDDHMAAEQMYKRWLALEPTDEVALRNYGRYLRLVRKDFSASARMYALANSSFKQNFVNTENPGPGSKESSRGGGGRGVKGRK